MLEVDGEMVCEESNLTSDEYEDDTDDSDDMEELSAEIEHSESSTTDDEEVEILDGEKSEEWQADIHPKESHMIVDQDIVAMDGSDRCGLYYFEIDSRERKLLANSNKVTESLDIVVGLKSCGDVSRLTKILEEKLAQNPDFAEKREKAKKKERNIRYFVRRLFTGCFIRK
nr:uncharacterized protein LOC107445359 [Parasteatoda tepidariorum]